jgi:hypothetical protein
VAKAHGRGFALVYATRPPQAAGGALQKKSRIALERCDVKRATFRLQLAQIAPHKLVFLDECGFGSSLYRLYGWVMGGGRCWEEVPWTKGHNLSLLGAFSLPSCGCANGLLLLWHKTGAWNRACFEAFLQDGLLPLLAPGSVLVLENARFHHGPRITDLVEAAGCSLALLARLQSYRTCLELDQRLR